MDGDAWMSHANASNGAGNAAIEPAAMQAAEARPAADAGKPGAMAAAPKQESAFAKVPLIGLFKKINPVLAIAIDRIDARPAGKSAVAAGLGGFLEGWAHFFKGMGSAAIQGKASVPVMLASGYKNASEHSPDAPDVIRQHSAEQMAEVGLSVLKGGLSPDRLAARD